MAYQHLDAGIQVEEFIPMVVREGQISQQGANVGIEIRGHASHITIQGVRVSQAQTFINERRVLVVSYNSQEPPGTLGYTVVVRPGYSVGDHYHHRREERILVLHGRAQFRLRDERPGSPSHGVLNVFTLDYPGAVVRVPTGVAHAIIADGTQTVLQVLASSDYDPTDDVHVTLSALPIWPEPQS